MYGYNVDTMVDGMVNWYAIVDMDSFLVTIAVKKARKPTTSVVG